jgi:transcriptional regulator with XRE-family HTH domain
MRYKMKIGEKIKQIRESKGFSQEALYYSSGVRIASISNIETGKCEPELATLKALATSFGMTVRELIKDVEF